jgi:hypothetical protein
MSASTLARGRAQVKSSKAARPTTCRLTLTIGDTSYAIKPIPSGWHAKAYQVRKLDGSGTVYHVAQEPDGAIGCTCPAGTYRDRCRHVRSLLAVGMLAPPQATHVARRRAFGEGIGG